MSLYIDDVIVFIFFFSSRRRHTRLQGDWSSDVCSSDLVECLPEDIPDHITADVTELTIGLNLRVSNLPLDPNKVKVLSDPNQVVAHVVVLKEEEVEKPAAEVAAATPAEPELIRKGKAEEEAEPEEGAAEAKETKKEGKKET